MSHAARHPARPLAWLLLGAVLTLSACRGAGVEPGQLARVGDAVLTEDEVAQALTVVPPGVDLETARSQYVEQWVTSQLLAQEARRRGLRDLPEVRRQLEESERSVLATALLSALYDEHAADISRAELEAYFERHRERLRLREPYVRVRFLETATAAAAEEARALLVGLAGGGLDPAASDSVFAAAARRLALDTTAVLALAGSYVPQSRLVRQVGTSPWSIVPQLAAGQTSEVMQTPEATYFVLQLVERVPAGAEPRIDWVADELRHRITVQHRRAVVAREVERLRYEAAARGHLRVADPEATP